MSKATLIEAVFQQHTLANKSGKPLAKAAVARLVNSVFSQASKQIASDGYFRYPGFGSFSIRARNARTMYRLPKNKGDKVDRSPSNRIQVEASNTVGFKPSSQLKGAVKGQKPTKQRVKKEQELA